MNFDTNKTPFLGATSAPPTNQSNTEETPTKTNSVFAFNPSSFNNGTNGPSNQNAFPVNNGTNPFALDNGTNPFAFNTNGTNPSNNINGTNPSNNKENTKQAASHIDADALVARIRAAQSHINQGHRLPWLLPQGSYQYHLPGVQLLLPPQTVLLRRSQATSPLTVPAGDGTGINESNDDDNNNTASAFRSPPSTPATTNNSSSASFNLSTPDAFNKIATGGIGNDSARSFSLSTPNSSLKIAPRTNVPSTPGRRGDHATTTLQAIVRAVQKGNRTYKHPSKKRWRSVDGYGIFDIDTYEATLLDPTVSVFDDGDGVTGSFFVRHKGRPVPADDDPKTPVLAAKTLAAVLVEKIWQSTKGAMYFCHPGFLDGEVAVQFLLAVSVMNWSDQKSMLSNSFRFCVEPMLGTSYGNYEQEFQVLLEKYLNVYLKATASPSDSQCHARNEYHATLALFKADRKDGLQLRTPKKRSTDSDEASYPSEEKKPAARSAPKKKPSTESDEASCPFEEKKPAPRSNDDDSGGEDDDSDDDDVMGGGGEAVGLTPQQQAYMASFQLFLQTDRANNEDVNKTARAASKVANENTKLAAETARAASKAANENTKLAAETAQKSGARMREALEGMKYMMSPPSSCKGPTKKSKRRDDDDEEHSAKRFRV